MLPKVKEKQLVAWHLDQPYDEWAHNGMQCYSWETEREADRDRERWFEMCVVFACRYLVAVSEPAMECNATVERHREEERDRERWFEMCVVFACRYLVAVLSMSGHWFGKNKEWILLTKFINHIDNTLDYKSQVELSIQMSYSNRILYQNATATRTCDAATTTLLPLQPLLLLKQCVLCHRMIPGFLESQCNANGMKGTK